MLRSDRTDLWLVAEDSEDDFCLLQRACSRLSPAPKLQRASDGVQAQQYLAGEEPFNNRDRYPLPSMVLSDLKMPLMDGLELLAWFKMQSWEPLIAFVLFTSSNAQIDRDRARKLAVDEYLEKPTSFDDLLKTVAQISERHGQSSA